MAEDKKLPIHKCQATGLLYIDEVPFTFDHLKKIRKLFKYGKKIGTGEQFRHDVIVCDNATGKVCTISEDLIDDIFKLYDVKALARDKDFEM